MRYRVKDYIITVSEEVVSVAIAVPPTKSPVSGVSTKPMEEAIRLIVDETAKVTFCSSMKKDNILSITPNNPSGYCSVQFAVPENKTVLSTDCFTIEMDWGDDISEIFEYLTDQSSDEFDGNAEDKLDLLLHFFGLETDLDNIDEWASKEELLAINDALWKSLVSYNKERVIVHALINGSDEEFHIYVDTNTSWINNGYDILFDGEGNLINTSESPAKNDEVYLYDPIESSN